MEADTRKDQVTRNGSLILVPPRRTGSFMVSERLMNSNGVLTTKGEF